MNSVFMLRAVERILAVLVGALSIYLGYHLFLSVPEHQDSEGKIVLSGGTSVYLNRVGPGVFFALFGGGIVALAIWRGIKYSAQDQDGNKSGTTKDGKIHSYSDSAINSDFRPRLTIEHIEQLFRIISTILNSKQGSIPDNIRQSLLVLYQEIYEMNKLEPEQYNRMMELKNKKRETSLSDQEQRDLQRLEQRVTTELQPSRLERLG